jgi:hypothetical protein
MRIREAIVQLLAIVPVAPGAGLALVVVTALAEGADRLAAEQALAARANRLALEEALTAGAGQMIFEEVLAEGVDRKVRKKALADLDARLEVALPMDAEKYAPMRIAYASILTRLSWGGLTAPPRPQLSPARCI